MARSAGRSFTGLLVHGDHSLGIYNGVARFYRFRDSGPGQSRRSLAHLHWPPGRLNHVTRSLQSSTHYVYLPCHDLSLLQRLPVVEWLEHVIRVRDQLL